MIETVQRFITFFKGIPLLENLMIGEITVCGKEEYSINRDARRPHNSLE